MQKNKTIERFWLFWGLAPKDSLKYKKGVDTLAFIFQERKQWEAELREKIERLPIEKKKWLGLNKGVKDWYREGINDALSLLESKEGREIVCNIKQPTR